MNAFLKFRREKQLTQEQLARILGCTSGYISKIEREKILPSENLIYQLKKAIKACNLEEEIKILENTDK